MSVLLANERGWLVDACSFIDEGFRRCYSVKKGHIRCYFRKQYFNILKPHIESRSRSECMIGALANTESHETGEAKVEPKTRKVRQMKSSNLRFKPSKHKCVSQTLSFKTPN